MLKRPSILSLALLGLLAIGSCVSVEPVSIDYLLPAEVSFPPELRRVGVVNNVPPQSTLRPELEHHQGPRRPGDPTYFMGDARVATEALARAIAKEDYFDEVVICDSALRQHDHTLRQTALSRGEVGKLARLLQVDVIIALENLPMKCTENVAYDAFEDEDMCTLDLTVYPVVRIYLPNRGAPMATITSTDSIYWETPGPARYQMRRRLIDEGGMVNEGSDFAGTVPLHKLLPHWQTAERTIFSGGTTQMRDAAVHVRRCQWDEAIALWEHDYRSKGKPKLHMRIAHNLAFGYEMCDSIDLAMRWATLADSLGTKVYGPDLTNARDREVVRAYRKELENRKKGYFLLDEQMRRFQQE